MKVLETAVGAVFASTRFSLVRISIRDLVADGKSLVRNSGVGGGGQILILKLGPNSEENFVNRSAERGGFDQGLFSKTGFRGSRGFLKLLEFP